MQQPLEQQHDRVRERGAPLSTTVEGSGHCALRRWIWDQCTTDMAGVASVIVPRLSHWTACRLLTTPTARDARPALSRCIRRRRLCPADLPVGDTTRRTYSTDDSSPVLFYSWRLPQRRA